SLTRSSGCWVLPRWSARALRAPRYITFWCSARSARRADGAVDVGHAVHGVAIGVGDCLVVGAPVANADGERRLEQRVDMPAAQPGLGVAAEIGGGHQHGGDARSLTIAAAEPPLQPMARAALLRLQRAIMGHVDADDRTAAHRRHDV